MAIVFPVSKQQTPMEETSFVKNASLPQPQPLQSQQSHSQQLKAKSTNSSQQSQTKHQQQRMSIKKLILFSFFPIAMTTSFAFSLAVLLPTQLIAIVGSESKAYVLGIIGAARALASVFSGLIAGYISDHLVTRFGKRMPMILIGSVINAMFLFSRAFLEKPGKNILACNAAAIVFGDMAGQMAMTCYMSLFPDLFVSEQMGLLSGLNSFVGLLATALGVSVLGYLYNTYVNPIILISIVCCWMILNALVLVLVFREPSWHYHTTARWVEPHEWKQACIQSSSTSSDDHEEVLLKCETGSAVATELTEISVEPSSVVKTATVLSEVQLEPIPTKKIAGIRIHLKQFFVKFFGIVIDIISTFKSWSFVWLFITRCFFTLGLGVVQNFSLYFFEDKVGPIYYFFKNTSLVTSSQQAQAVFMLCVLVTGLISSISGGVISDRVGRRSVITLSSLMLSVGLICMGIFTWNFTILLACAIFIGLGIGAFLAADLGLANDIIDPSSSAKELATFQMAQTLPSVVSSPLSGLIVQLSELIKLKRIKADHIGYNILLFFCAALSMATALGIWCVRVDSKTSVQYDSSEEETTPDELDHHEDHESKQPDDIIEGAGECIEGAEGTRSISAHEGTSDINLPQQDE